MDIFLRRSKDLAIGFSSWQFGFQFGNPIFNPVLQCAARTGGVSAFQCFAI
jgi:hypothetical protein